MMSVRPSRLAAAVPAVLAVAAALLLVASPAPALAAPPQGTAAIDTPGSPQPLEVVAGTPSQPFEVTLHNPGLADGVAPATVDWVMLLPPPDDYTVTELAGPGGWEGRTFSDGRVIFTGDTLAGGDSATFHVEANVSRPGRDVALPWRVLASDDGGETATQYRATSDGALTPVIRVLDVTGNRFTGPDGVLDGDTALAATRGPDELPALPRTGGATAGLGLPLIVGAVVLRRRRP